MKVPTIVFSCLLCLIGIVILFAETESVAERTTGDTAGNAFAVVELFTSEGCSSCPPADRLLGKIISNARDKDQPIYGLAFHVDYWDYIGWKDPYASSEFSDRQRRYARAFGSSRIYTPQMVVNGRREFVGSNEHNANSAIQSALAQPPVVTVKIMLSEVRTSQSEVMFSYKIPPVPEDAVLNFALVERQLEQDVRRGENRGRTLQHQNVVRAFRTVESGKLSDNLSLKVPEGVRLENSSLIAYLQHDRTMEVLGATGVDL